jgi:hypothetical protein
MQFKITTATLREHSQQWRGARGSLKNNVFYRIFLFYFVGSITIVGRIRITDKPEHFVSLYLLVLFATVLIVLIINPTTIYYSILFGRKHHNVIR